MSLSSSQPLDGAIIHREAGRYKEAAQSVRGRLAMYPEDSEAWALLAQVLSLDGQDGPAWEAMNKALSLNSGLALVQRNHARLLLKQQHLDAALQVAQAVYQGDPQHPENQQVLAAVLRARNQPEPARALLEQALQRWPDYAEALANLALIKLQSSDPAGALADAERAVALKPHLFQLWSVVAMLRRQFRDLAGAIVALEKVLAYEPDAVENLITLGNLYVAVGRFREAETAYRRTLVIKPDVAEIHANLANVLRELGRLMEAESYCRQALAIKPELAGLHSNLGNILRDLRRLSEAEACFRRALQLKPDYATAYSNLANIYNDFGKLKEAEANYRHALALAPNFAEAYNNLADLLKNTGRLQEAEANCRHALELNPEYAAAHMNLGNILREDGRLQEAEVSCSRALELKPEYADAYVNLGTIYGALGQLDDAIVSYRRALELKPDFTDACSNLLFSLNYTAHGHLPEHFNEACAFGQLVSAKAAPRYASWQCEPTPQRLRIGLVSGDLHGHPVGFFLEAVLARLDPARLELIAYPTAPRHDDLTERIRPCFAAWKPLTGLSDQAAARLIHDDGVHILLDLAGHTAKNRLPVFAWKPAPVQVSWLGYFATTGLKEMDYLLGDPYVTPEPEADHFTETIWRLPETYLCFTPPTNDLPVGPLPALASGVITFGSFNNLSKLNDAVVTLWAKVLQALPQSRLFLKTKQLNDPKVCETTLQRFAACGITPERLLLEGGSPRTELLAAYNRVDIALDSFPYPGGTTSVEALWMGVPVLTRQGNRFLSHIGESIAHNAGLSDWIAADDDEYVAKALQHTADLQRLAAMRTGLRGQVLASPLFDAVRFARNLETALWQMWEGRQEFQREAGSFNK